MTIGDSLLTNRMIQGTMLLIVLVSLFVVVGVVSVVVVGVVEVAVIVVDWLSC